MSTVNTSHRNYVFPLKDEDLEASNAILNASFNMIDLDVHNLFTDKANIADTDSSTEVDTKITDAITALDVYGTYDGDVASDPIDNTKLYLKDIFSTPGSYTKVSVNAKGQITFGEQLSKTDITDYNEQDYLLDIDIKDTVTDTVSLWSSDKIDTELNKYVLLTNYTDNDVLTKIKNVDGTGSGLDADLLDGEEGSHYLTMTNMDFVDSNYVHTTGTESVAGDKTFSGTIVFDGEVNLSGDTNVNANAVFDDNSNSSTAKGWTALKIFTEISNASQTSSYGIKFSVADIAARDALTAEDGDLAVVGSDRTVYKFTTVWSTFFELDGAHTHTFSSLTSKPSTLLGYGIDNAYTKTETEALNWDWSDITSGAPTTIAGYGITDDIAIDASYVHTDNNYTSTEKTKLGTIEDSATADQTGAEIKTAYELEADTNAYDNAAAAKMLSVNQSGDTASRPVGVISEMYFDTDLGTTGKPIWYDGTQWVDATGTAV